MNNKEKLTICFHPWLIYNQTDNYDELIKEIADRGFNCIRIDDGAGLIWDKDGNVRNDVLISQPFGKYTKYTTYRTIVDGKRLNIGYQFTLSDINLVLSIGLQLKEQTELV